MSQFYESSDFYLVAFLIASGEQLTATTNEMQRLSLHLSGQ